MKNLTNETKLREPPGTLGYEVKQLPAETIDSVISQLPLKTTPRDLQSRCLYLSIDQDTFMFALGMGLGKSKLSLDIATTSKFLTGNVRALAICPPIVVRHWRNEVAKHSNLSVQIADAKTPEKRMEQIMYSTADITVVAHTWLVAQFSKANKRDKMGNQSKKSREWEEMLLKMFRSFNQLFIDEAHALRNPNTVGFKGYRRYFLEIKQRYLLTGTPIGNNQTGVWALYYIMDKGATFGTSYHEFLAKYFYAYDNGRYIKYTLRKKTEAEFMAKFWSKCIRWEDSECNDLPDKSFNTLPVVLTSAQNTAYDDLLKDNRVNGYGDEIIPEFELMKITAGIGFPSSPKLDAVKELVNDVCVEQGRQFIVWCWLREESDYLVENLSKHFKKLRVVSIKGEGTQARKDGILNDWAAGDVDVLVANQASLGVGVDLYESNACCFFSNPRSIIMRLQSLKRIHRTGQTRHCYYYDIVAEDTIDELNLRIVHNAGQTFTQLTKDNQTLPKADLKRQRGR